MNQPESYFSNRALKNLIVPLFMEQLLTILVGIADIFAVSFVGEAAVSGVSLVNAFNTIFIYLFTALASGGAVVISSILHAGNLILPIRRPASFWFLLFYFLSVWRC